jgi:hypothetical protein
MTDIVTPPTRFEVSALGTHALLEHMMQDAFRTSTKLGCYMCLADETGEIIQKIGTFSTPNIEGELAKCTAKIRLLVEHKDYLSSAQADLKKDGAVRTTTGEIISVSGLPGEGWNEALATVTALRCTAGMPHRRVRQIEFFSKNRWIRQLMKVCGLPV